MVQTHTNKLVVWLTIVEIAGPNKAEPELRWIISLKSLSSMAENTIKKLEEQLNCAICLDTYTDPKLLQCFHVYCRQCLVKLVVRDQQGQLILTCPTCRQATPVPANGVAGLQSAFQVNHLLEILEEHKKAKDTAASQEGAKSVMTPPIPSTKSCEYTGKEQELYCETCGDFIFSKSVDEGGEHHDHNYHVLDEAFERYKKEIAPLLEPLEGKSMDVKGALTQLGKCCEEISDQQAVIETKIHKTIRKLQEILEVRKTELIGELHRITQDKLKILALQSDQIKNTETQLSSCLNFAKERPKTGSREEIQTRKTSLTKQVKELTLALQPDLLEPNEGADMRLSVPSQEVTEALQKCGQVLFSGSPDPSKCEVIIRDSLKATIVGEKATAMMLPMNIEGRAWMKPIKSLQCELVSQMTGAAEPCDFERRRWNFYEINYQPTIKGSHRLTIKIEDKHIKGSPYVVKARPRALEKFAASILTIRGIKPGGLTVNQKGELVVTEPRKHCISVFNPNGEQILSFGTCGHNHGQFDSPLGVELDDEGNILVADINNHRIQKFTASGHFLSAIGAQGKKPLHFDGPMDIAFNYKSRKIYVVDHKNNRIQVLNSDLTFSSTFGEEGEGNGQFKDPTSIACDSSGNVFVTDSFNFRIQVFTAQGQFLKMFKTYPHSKDVVDKQNYPVGIAIDTNDMVYVNEGYYDLSILHRIRVYAIHRISVFSLNGEYITSFCEVGEGPGKFKYHCGVAVDSGVAYVCDRYNDCIQVF